MVDQCLNLRLHPFYSLNQCREEADPTYNGDKFLDRLKIDWRWRNAIGVMRIQSRSLSDPSLFGMDFISKMAWVWTILKISWTSYLSSKS